MTRNSAKSNVEVSIVVLAYKSEKVISQCLVSLMHQISPYICEVIVINSFPDRTPNIVQQHFPSVKLKHFERRLLPGQARNVGIKTATGEFILFLASDCQAPSDWVSRRMFHHRRGYLCVSGTIDSIYKWNPVALCEHWIEYSNFLEMNREGENYKSIPHTVSYSNDIFSRYGLFNENLYAGEDTLFNKALMRQGEKIYFDPHIVVFHRSSSRLVEFITHQFKHGEALVKYRILDTQSKWKSQSNLRHFLNLSIVFILKRLYLTYKRIFIGQRKYFLLSFIWAPLIILGIFSISLGALIRLFSQGSSQNMK